MLETPALPLCAWCWAVSSCLTCSLSKEQGLPPSLYDLLSNVFFEVRLLVFKNQSRHIFEVEECVAGCLRLCRRA